ncbi:MAG: metallophosphoesterase [Terrestrivirus sp.]|uniref:Metallophosphoesterase n=1 Tax=Terrestrivirus sp. TaxID=2487775 RepID=A0A3G4ZND4_9VIRU|nr:MAG: metallophosphoesterase [Terrestrivirus sp.]
MSLNVTIKTWNTLHLFHEVNYVFENSYVLEKYNIKRDPMRELLRIEDIVKILKKELGTNTVICLQEVSGDLFEELVRQNFCAVFHKEMDDVPSIYQDDDHLERLIFKSIYANCKEYQVVLVSNDLKDRIKSFRTILFTADDSKGAVVVEFDDFVVVGTHIPWNDTKRIQSLKQIFEDVSFVKPFIVAGDFNREHDKLVKDLVDVPLRFASKVNVHTFQIIRDGVVENELIDHVLVFCKDEFNFKGSVSVREDDKVSDHRLVSIEFA